MPKPDADLHHAAADVRYEIQRLFQAAILFPRAAEEDPALFELPLSGSRRACLALGQEEPSAPRRGERWRRATTLLETENKKTKDPRLA